MTSHSHKFGQEKFNHISCKRMETCELMCSCVFYGISPVTQTGTELGPGWAEQSALTNLTVLGTLGALDWFLSQSNLYCYFNIINILRDISI